MQTLRNNVECFIDPLDRTKDAIYLGERGSIRKGPNKSESRPLANLERYLKWIDKPQIDPMNRQTVELPDWDT